MKKAAIFLDRDGILNQKPNEHDYVKSLEELILLPKIEKAVKLAKDKGFRVVVISNQRGVARGVMDEEVVDRISQHLNNFLGSYGTSIDKFYYCFHDYSDDCTCRKPASGLILKALQELDIDIFQSWMIGDSESDRQAALKAGLTEDHIVIINPNSSLLDAVGKVLSNE